ncbi:MAG: YolD-like family protein [Ruminococcus sp.]|nr:YolD-like family protein [Ruminococcus sp.]
MNETNFRYNDIINLPRHTSKTRPHMSGHDRAAQFMPFAALTGFGAIINETSRLTVKKHELSEEEFRLLNERLNSIIEHISEKPRVSVTYFTKDERKAGGRYETFSGNVRRVDTFTKELIFADKFKIQIEDILLIEIN